MTIWIDPDAPIPEPEEPHVPDYWCYQYEWGFGVYDLEIETPGEGYSASWPMSEEQLDRVHAGDVIEVDGDDELVVREARPSDIPPGALLPPEPAI